MYFLYILKSTKFNWTYIGITADIEARLKRHNSGQVKSTQFYRPFILMHTESYASRNEVSERELELKNNSYKKRELLISLNLL